MSKITSIATSLPPYKHNQASLFNFADTVYNKDSTDTRKLKFLYRQSAIEHRYSVIPDFSFDNVADRTFFSKSADLEPFADIEQRMALYDKTAPQLAVEAIAACIENKLDAQQITHLITVSCTGMSAPGLDLQIMEMMGLPVNINRTSVNFMGCYAAIHGLKLADAFCSGNSNANVVVVCTELCTIHFQKEYSVDNITASLLFGDGCGAMLIQNNNKTAGICLDHFYSEVSFKGKKEMAWQISSKGFLMTLTGYVPELIKEDFENLVINALSSGKKQLKDVSHWCIHPGGKKILDAITQCLQLKNDALAHSYSVLKDFGNMSSASIVFVLKKMMEDFTEGPNKDNCIFAAAFGPGLTMETFTAHYA